MFANGYPSEVKKLLIFLLALSPARGFAQGGPPMVTDDPGTPGNGHWEINVASLGTFAPSNQVILVPYIDANYGLGERLQLKVETGWAFAFQGPVKNGADTLLAGVKYRFLDEDKAGISVSTYPQFQFHHFFSSQDPELTTPGNELLLPIELSKTFGSWEVNPEVGYLYATQIPHELAYGVVLGYEALKPWELLAEVHVNTWLDGSGSLTLLNVGTRLTINANLNLLAALGRTVTVPDGEEQGFETYLGAQFEL
jgi:hypothetical protein